MAETKVFEFEGRPTGDCECFCFAVQPSEFERVEGKSPRKWDMIDSGEALLYPNAFFALGDRGLYKVRVEVTKL